MANSVGPDQTPPGDASDQSPHYPQMVQLFSNRFSEAHSAGHLQITRLIVFRPQQSMQQMWVIPSLIIHYIVYNNNNNDNA